MTALYPRAVILGDQLTRSDGASIRNNGYAKVLTIGLQARDSFNTAFSLVDGVVNLTTAGLINKIVAMNIKPVTDLLVLEIGSQDFLQGVAAATFQAQYVSALLPTLKQNAPNAVLVGLNCWADPTAAATYNNVISSAIAGSGFPSHYYIDIGSMYNTVGYRAASGDTYDPTDAGHAAIANAILAVLP